MGIGIGILLLIILVLPVLVGFAGFALFDYRRDWLKVKEAVRITRVAIKDHLEQFDDLIGNPDVQQETWRKFIELKKRSSVIDRRIDAGERIDWASTARELESINSSLMMTLRVMAREIFVTREGPKLMRQIPRLLEATEKALAIGSPSVQALMYLDAARANYAEVEAKVTQMSKPEWNTLYELLDYAQLNLKNALNSV